MECTFTFNDEYVVSGSECGAVAIYPVTNEKNSNDGDGTRAKAKAMVL